MSASRLLVGMEVCVETESGTTHVAVLLDSTGTTAKVNTPETKFRMFHYISTFSMLPFLATDVGVR